MRMRNGLEGVGAALLLFPYFLSFFHPENHELYHHGLSVTHLIGGLLVDLLGCSILVTSLLVAVQHLRPSLRRVSEGIFAGLMLWCIADFTFQILMCLHYPFASPSRVWAQTAIAIPLLAGVLARFFPSYTTPAVRAVRLAVAAFAFSALWIVPQLIHLALARQPSVWAASIAPADYSGSGSKPRIIWILLDELSYDQAFEHVASGIQLSNLNGLRSRSVSFSKLKPEGYTTDRIIPSLFIGRHIDRFRSTIYGDLSYWDESQHRWSAYDANATLFGLAKRSGWKSGIDGWYNPYCETLASVLSARYRNPGIVFVPMEEYGASEDKSVLANAAILPDEFVAALAHSKKITADEHMQAYLDIMAHTQALIEDSQLSFVFLHLPVPHPPGIYDRQRHMLRPGGDYLDNLVLADDTLGVLMRQIDTSPSASETTVIVTSDHSWRTAMWKHAEDWSDDEERASGGKFDDRPVFLVHFANQRDGEDVHAALPEMLEHDVIAEMLLGQGQYPRQSRISANLFEGIFVPAICACEALRLSLWRSGPSLPACRPEQGLVGSLR